MQDTNLFSKIIQIDETEILKNKFEDIKNTLINYDNLLKDKEFKGQEQSLNKINEYVSKLLTIINCLKNKEKFLAYFRKLESINDISKEINDNMAKIYNELKQLSQLKNDTITEFSNKDFAEDLVYIINILKEQPQKVNESSENLANTVDDQYENIFDDAIEATVSAYIFKEKCNVVQIFLERYKELFMEKSFSDDQKSTLSQIKVLIEDLKKIIDSLSRENYLDIIRKIKYKEVSYKINEKMHEIDEKVHSLITNEDFDNFPTDNYYQDYIQIYDLFDQSIDEFHDQQRKVNISLRFSSYPSDKVSVDKLNEIICNENKQFEIIKPIILNKKTEINAKNFNYYNAEIEYHYNESSEKIEKRPVTITVLRDEKKRLLSRILKLKDMDHKYIGKFIGFFKNDEKNNIGYSIVTERDHDSKNLLNVIKKNDLLPGERTILAFKIAQAMSYVHSRNFAHRYLFSISILVSYDDENEIKPTIIGFENSREMPNNPDICNTIFGDDDDDSPKFFAPEIYTKKYNQKVDVFTFASILYQLEKGTIPDGASRDIINGGRPKLDGIPPKLANLIEKCWRQDPKERPSFGQILQEMADGVIFTDDIDEQDTVNEFYQKNIEVIADSQINECIKRFDDIKENIVEACQYKYELDTIFQFINNYQSFLSNEYLSCAKQFYNDNDNNNNDNNNNDNNNNDNNENNNDNDNNNNNNTSNSISLKDDEKNYKIVEDLLKYTNNLYAITNLSHDVWIQEIEGIKTQAPEISPKDVAVRTSAKTPEKLQIQKPSKATTTAESQESDKDAQEKVQIYDISKFTEKINEYMNNIYDRIVKLGYNGIKYESLDEDLILDCKELDFSIRKVIGINKKSDILKSIAKFMKGKNLNFKEFNNIAQERIISKFCRFERYNFDSKDIGMDYVSTNNLQFTALQPYSIRLPYGSDYVRKDKFVAIKKISIQSILKNIDSSYDNIREEIETIKECNHGNIAKFVGYSTDQKHVYIILEQPRTSYSTNNKSNEDIFSIHGLFSNQSDEIADKSSKIAAFISNLEPEQKTNYAIKIAEIMHYLNDKNIRYHDINLTHFIFIEDPILIDFCNTRQQQIEITPEETKDDIYSYCKLLLLFNKNISDISEEDIKNYITNNLKVGNSMKRIDKLIISGLIHKFKQKINFDFTKANLYDIESFKNIINYFKNDEIKFSDEKTQ